MFKLLSVPKIIHKKISTFEVAKTMRSYRQSQKGMGGCEASRT